MTGVAPVFAGFESIPSSGGGTAGVRSGLASKVDRLLTRLDEAGCDPSTLLQVDAFTTTPGRDLRRELAGLLPAQACPVVSVTRVRRVAGTLGTALQAVAVPGASVRAGPKEIGDGSRFPQFAIAAGRWFAATTPRGAATENIVKQSRNGLVNVRDGLAGLGASMADVTKFNIFYRGDGTRGDWAASARIRAEHFAEPGPCATGIPVLAHDDPSTAIAHHVLGVGGARRSSRIVSAWPPEHWNWPFHLPYRHGNRVGRTCFVGGQVSLDPDSSVVNPGDLAAQTTTVVRNIRTVLAELGAELRDVVRLTAFYEERGAADAEIIRAGVRAALPEVACELSLIGMDALAYPQMLVEIECQAIVHRTDMPADGELRT